MIGLKDPDVFAVSSKLTGSTTQQDHAMSHQERHHRIALDESPATNKNNPSRTVALLKKKDRGSSKEQFVDYVNDENDTKDSPPKLQQDAGQREESEMLCKKNRPASTTWHGSEPTKEYGIKGDDRPEIKPVTSMSGQTSDKVRTSDNVRISASSGPKDEKTKAEKETHEDNQPAWPMDLHRAFVGAILEIGIKSCSPSVIMNGMKNLPPYITRERTKSHLQKYRKTADRSKAEFLKDYDGFLAKVEAMAGPLEGSSQQDDSAMVAEVVASASGKETSLETSEHPGSSADQKDMAKADEMTEKGINKERQDASEPARATKAKRTIETILDGKKAQKVVGGEAAAMTTYAVLAGVPPQRPSNLLPFKATKTDVPELNEEELKTETGETLTQVHGLLTFLIDYLLRTRHGLPVSVEGLVKVKQSPHMPVSFANVPLPCHYRSLAGSAKAYSSSLHGHPSVHAHVRAPGSINGVRLSAHCYDSYLPPTRRPGDKTSVNTAYLPPPSYCQAGIPTAPTPVYCQLGGPHWNGPHYPAAPHAAVRSSQQLYRCPPVIPGCPPHPQSARGASTEWSGYGGVPPYHAGYPAVAPRPAHYGKTAPPIHQAAAAYHSGYSPYSNVGYALPYGNSSSAPEWRDPYAALDGGGQRDEFCGYNKHLGNARPPQAPTPHFNHQEKEEDDLQDHVSCRKRRRKRRGPSSGMANNFGSGAPFEEYQIRQSPVPEDPEEIDMSMRSIPHLRDVFDQNIHRPDIDCYAGANIFATEDKKRPPSVMSFGIGSTGEENIE